MDNLLYFLFLDQLELEIDLPTYQNLIMEFFFT